MEQDQATGPLAHLKVLELTVAIQGPGAGLYLRDMGADVIKIEPPLGDASRYHRGVNNTLPPEAMGAQFVAMNRGKRSLCVDVHTELGKETMRRLIRDADVLLSNYRAPALQRMGLDYETVHALNPQLVYASANGFGPKGPDADKSMLDGAAIARGGLASMTGGADTGPIAPGAAVADTASAMMLALAIVTALVAREQTGFGQCVQTSALGAQLWLQQWELTHVWMTGHKLKRSGAHHANIQAPYGIYETADGDHFLFAVAYSNDAWDAFWVFVDDPAEALNPKWDAPGKRLGTGASEADAREIQTRMRTAFRSRTTAEWEAFLGSQPDIVFERVQDYDQVRADPQCIANEYLETMDLPGAGETTIVGNLVAFSDTPASTRGLPPGIGADSAQILGDLGFNESEIATMVDDATSKREVVLGALLGAQES